MHCAIDSWRGGCPSLAGYVTVTGATDGAIAVGGRIDVPYGPGSWALMLTRETANVAYRSRTAATSVK